MMGVCRHSLLDACGLVTISFWISGTGERRQFRRTALAGSNRPMMSCFLFCVGNRSRLRVWVAGAWAVAGCLSLTSFAGAQTGPMRPASEQVPLPVRSFVDQYCVTCHNHADAVGGLSLERADAEDVASRADTWELVVRRLSGRQMPPLDAARPDETAYESTLHALTAALDRAAAVHPNPGRTDSIRRLTRFEYRNAIRDLLGLDVDVTAILPKDESSHGFDNITLAELSPTLLQRYVTAAERISRLAAGRLGTSPVGHTIRVRADLTQEQHLDGLPLGTRGGTSIRYTFPQDGVYEIQVRLARDRNEHVEGLAEAHELEVLVDRRRAALFTIEPPAERQDHELVDAHLKSRVSVVAGPHQVGVTFPKKPTSLPETKRQPHDARFNMHRHPRASPAVYEVSITGPFSTAPSADLAAGGARPVRHGVLAAVRDPDAPPAHIAKRNAPDTQAARILGPLLQRAYRRPITDEDLRRPLTFFQEGYDEGGFDGGIERALCSVLVSPSFLFRVERDPPGVSPGGAYAVSDLELASRISFFLWGSIPDEELLAAAIHGDLRHPDVLQRQVARLLADGRAGALVENFADQWLQLRNLESAMPDQRLFPDFDDNLRQAMRKETELFVESVLREDRNVVDLLRADYTFLNERLARHYGIPHIHGSRFRRVALGEGRERGGLLRHASMQTVTSYATRTSPVIRGKWILENLLGTPPPPPPANVPALEDNTVSAQLPVRERLAAHRAHEACAGCHRIMDPVGFALENYDAVGRWRSKELDHAVDAAGGLPDGATFVGVGGLEDALTQRPELFVRTLTEKLLTYALGRPLDHSDAPAVRKIVREAGDDGYRFSSLIQRIVSSAPFQMRRAE